MSLKYARQDPQVLFSAVTLTAAYTGNASTGIPMDGYAENTIYVDYVPAVSGSSIQLKFEGSPDNEGQYPVSPTPATNPVLVTPTYYQQTASSVSGGTITLSQSEYTYVGTTLGTHYRIYFYLPPAHTYAKISIKETTAGAFGTATVTLLKSGG